MNFNNWGATSAAKLNMRDGAGPKPGLFSFLRGKLGEFGNRTAAAKYGEAYSGEKDPSKRRQMMVGAVADGLNSFGAGDAPEPPPLVNPGTVGGGVSMADVLQMMRSRREQQPVMGRYGVRGLFG